MTENKGVCDFKIGGPRQHRQVLHCLCCVSGDPTDKCSWA